MNNHAFDYTTILIDESNGNSLFNVKTTTTQNVLSKSLSNEDLSLSLSDYTDADESMSAPTEILAEFLSAVMLKDYKEAFKYCKLILKYEPNNATAKEFYPLIQQKLTHELSNENDKNSNKSSSPEGLVATCSGTSENLSSDSEDNSDSDDNVIDVFNSNISTSRSDNTTHSYSSLLLEEEDDVPNTSTNKDLQTTDLDLSNGNYKPNSWTGSESPTEPLTQRIAAILRSKCIPGNTK